MSNTAYRRTGRPGVPVKGKQEAAPTDVDMDQDFEEYDAVSYTHLTLPTT